MRKYLKIFTILISGLFTTAVKAEPIKIGPAELSFNAGYMSQYIWRGQDQNDNSGSPYFGADLALPYDLYVGTWTASADGTGYSQEIDLYAGIAPSFGPVSLDLGYIEYRYPGAREESNFGEFYGIISIAPEGMPVSFGASYYEEDQDTSGVSEYIDYSISFDTGKGVTLGALYGDYDTTNKFWQATADASYGGLDFTLAYIDNDMDDAASEDKEFVTLTIGKSF